MTKIGDNGKPMYGQSILMPDGSLSWGDANRINTNFTALTYLQDVTNDLCVLHNKEERINFTPYIKPFDIWKLLNEIKKMLRLVDEFQDIIFDEDGEIYKSMIIIVTNSWEQGLKYTRHFTSNYKTFFPTATDIIVSDDETGNYVDMVEGADAYLVFKAKAGVQIKGGKCHLISDEYRVYASVGLKKYEKIWSFVFYDTLHKQIYIFKNITDKIREEIIDGKIAIIFPKELLQGKFDYNGNK